jgi:lauroyl/myristoyl acyltransferase
MVTAPAADLQRALAELLEHDLGRRDLAFATPEQLRALARDLVRDADGGFVGAVKAAAQRLQLGCDADEVAREHVEHLVWVAHRRAFWETRARASRDLPGFVFSTENTHHVLQTAGHPTVLITPMMLVYEDALWIADAAFAGREVAMYGEELIGDATFATLDALCSFERVRLAAGPRDILGVLDRNGMFVTYPDFTYAGHAVRHTAFFGMQWPFSSAFLRICARPGTMLLPAFIRHAGDGVTFHFAEPLLIELPRGAPVDRRWTEPLVAATVARLLEAMIAANPAQWQLLVTLVAKCEQRAR